MTHEKVIKMIDEYILQDNINEEWVEALKVCRQSLLDVEIQKAEIDILIRKKDNLRDEISKLEYTIVGIMHSVDKWLDEDELKQDEVNRAITMREKTLQITEKQQTEIERLQKNLVETETRISMGDRLITEIKSEAYMKFAERLKKYIPHFDDGHTTMECVMGAIRYTVNELTGDGNG